MHIQYRIFNAWYELDNVPDIQDFMCYQARDKIITLNYADMRRLFMSGTKSQVIEANAKLTMALSEILDNGKEEGTIEL